MRSLLIAAVLAAGPALADSEARQGADWVRIFDSPCVSAQTLVLIPPEARSDFQKAQGVYKGEKFFGCWQKRGGIVYILWEDGDHAIIPIEALRRVTEA